MKKFLIFSLLLPLTSFASTASLSPASITLTPGQTITLTIVVDPQGTAYTAKVGLSYPSNLLAFTSFSQSSGWLSLSQPGYDVVDNTSGTLVKTAGYSGGILAPRVFGTVTFKALAAGTATIAVNGTTQILDAENRNTFTSGGTVALTINKPVPAPATVTKTKPKATTTPERSWLATSTASTTPISIAQSSQTANILSSMNKEEGLIGLSALAAALTFFLGLALGRLRTRL